MLLVHQEKNWNIRNGPAPRSISELIWNIRYFREGIIKICTENDSALQFERKLRKAEKIKRKNKSKKGNGNRI